jgi:phage shock protein PspC (stress-responsive transcriptional regulator)
MNKLKNFLEWQVFGICDIVGERMGIATNIIRKYFIYISFLTLGSPLIVYFFLGFWMNVKKYVRISKRHQLGI